MIHLALPARSTRSDAPYSTPGLGDRIHSCLLGYQYARARNEPVMLHLTQDKVNRAEKADSWVEVLGLFAPWVTSRAHAVSPKTESEWIAYLKVKHGIDAETYHYGGHGRGFDAELYLASSPVLLAPVSELARPAGPYATVNWIGGGQAHDLRRISAVEQSRAEARYRDQGIDLVHVGDDAEDPLLRRSLADVAFMMAGAEFHAGIDSGPMHLASCFLPYDRLHVYVARGRSHHVLRWIENGAVQA